MQRWLICAGLLLIAPSEAYSGQIAAAQSCLLGSGFVSCIEKVDFSKEPDQAAWLAKCRSKPEDLREQCYLDTLTQLDYVFSSPQQVEEQTARNKKLKEELEREREETRKNYEERAKQRAEQIKQLEEGSGRVSSASVVGSSLSSKIIASDTSQTQATAVKAPPPVSDEDQDPTHDAAYCLSMEAEKISIQKYKYSTGIEYLVGFSYIVKNGCRKKFNPVYLRSSGMNWNDQSIIYSDFSISIGPFQEEKGRLSFYKIVNQRDFDAIKTVTIKARK